MLDLKNITDEEFSMRKLEKKLLSLWNTILEQKRNIQKSLPLI